MFRSVLICVPSNLMANRQVPKFSLHKCAQSSKKTFMCPKFHTNPVLKYTKCHISTNLSNFLKLRLLYSRNLFALASTNRRFAEKNRLGGNTGSDISIFYAVCAFCTLVLTLLVLRFSPKMSFFYCIWLLSQTSVLSH